VSVVADDAEQPLNTTGERGQFAESLGDLLPDGIDRQRVRGHAITGTDARLTILTIALPKVATAQDGTGPARETRNRPQLGRLHFRCRTRFAKGHNVGENLRLEQQRAPLGARRRQW
jgi:hypothetical protein